MKTNLMSSLKITHSLLLALFASLTITIFSPLVSAQVVHRSSDFNHMRTGFPLTGVHSRVDCETCHVGGLFKGTPKNCAGCHSQGRGVVATYKSAKHIITNAPCETCHTNTVTFLGARFNHIGVQPRACMTCHNGFIAQGKPAGHVLTVSSCDVCHRTSSWIPAGYDHLGVVPGSCATCHNGSTAKGKPSFHITTIAACDTCHHNFTTFYGAGYDHVGANPLTCGNCHNGQSLEAKQRPGNHIPYSGTACGSCHTNTASYTTFSIAPSTTNVHSVILGTPCKTCHTSNIYLGVTGPKKALNHYELYAGQTDCSSAGCHLPGAGGRGSLYTAW